MDIIINRFSGTDSETTEDIVLNDAECKLLVKLLKSILKTAPKYYSCEFNIKVEVI